MEANRAACMGFVLREEGGYGNDPRDPGGETRFGISKRSHPHLDIAALTEADAIALYTANEWRTLACAALPAGLDLVAFDAGVNSGVTRSARWLQGALRVAADGRIGPVTLAAAQAQPALPVIEAACATRMAFLRGLRTFAAFGRGWTARVARVEARATAMAVAAAGVDPRPVLAARAAAAESAARARTTRATASLGTGGLVAGAAPLPHWALAALVAITVAVAVLLILKRRQDRARAAAFRIEGDLT
ncbi:MAG: glycoside hydrolase family 108 protein [Halothiobacillaceae bacterium]